MTAAAPTARRWTCDRCQVSVGRMDDGQAPLPESWVIGADGSFCLTCRRERASEAALEAAPLDCSNDVKAKARRAGLIEFEVRRTPDLPDNAIARACRTSASAVAATRQAIGRR